MPPGRKPKGKKPPALRTQAAARLVDKNSRTMAKMIQLIESMQAKADRSELEREIIGKRIEKLKKRINRRLQKLAKWADLPPEDRIADLRGPMPMEAMATRGSMIPGRPGPAYAANARMGGAGGMPMRMQPNVTLPQFNQPKQLQELRDQFIRQKGGPAGMNAASMPRPMMPNMGYMQYQMPMHGMTQMPQMQNMQAMQNMQTMQTMQNMQNMQSMQNMQQYQMQMQSYQAMQALAQKGVSLPQFSNMGVHTMPTMIHPASGSSGVGAASGASSNSQDINVILEQRQRNTANALKNLRNGL